MPRTTSFISKLSIAAASAAFVPAFALAAGGHAGGHAEGHGAAAAHGAAAQAHGSGHAHGHASSAVGQPGDAAKVSRTVTVEMHDTMRFTPEKVSVKAGETIRFFVVNKGKVAHEMVIGSKEELAEHAEMMRKMPHMDHKDPNMIRLGAGKRGGMVWQFTQAGEVPFACLIPGHFEAGMVGAVDVR